MDPKPDRQLGQYETTSAALDGAGAALADVVTQVAVDTAGFVGLPRTGWRPIAQRRSGRTQLVYAAPRPAGDGWATVALIEAADGWRATTDPGPVTARPSRHDRSRGLELVWPEDPITVWSGRPLDFEVLLHNGAGTGSFADGGDSAYVRGWLLDGTGTRLPAADWYSYRFDTAVPALRPGADARLAVTLATYESAAVPPGRYRIEAGLPSLGLWSSRGKVVVR